MSTTLRVILLIGVIVYFVIVVHLLKKKRLTLKYSLLWLFMGCVLLLLAIFPKILGWICHLLGFEDTMNGLFTIAIGFILVLVMALTAIVSKQTDRIKNLVQDNALLEQRLREVEEKVGNS
jgi:hypothetical protein